STRRRSSAYSPLSLSSTWPLRMQMPSTETGTLPQGSGLRRLWRGSFGGQVARGGDDALVIPAALPCRRGVDRNLRCGRDRLQSMVDDHPVVFDVLTEDDTSMPAVLGDQHPGQARPSAVVDQG